MQTIHQIWLHPSEREIPDCYHPQWRESLVDHNPGWTYVLWKEEETADFVSTHYPEMSSIYNAFPRVVQRVDFLKYLLIDHFGGLYADLDTKCDGSLTELLEHDFVVSLQAHLAPEIQRRYFHKYRDIFSNGFFYGKPNHVVMRSLIQRIAEQASAPPDKLRFLPEQERIYHTTGPAIFSEVVNDAVYSDDAHQITLLENLACHQCITEYVVGYWRSSDV